MTTRQIRDLAIKILGLYFLTHAIIFLPQILSFFRLSGPETELVTHKAAFIFVSLIPSAMYFAVAFVLLIKTQATMALLWPKVDNDAGITASSLSLTSWISLVGLFYLIGSAGGTASELWILGVNRKMMGGSLSFRFLPDIITMVLSAICIVQARRIADYLKKTTE
jgi:hypothetical protein